MTPALTTAPKHLGRYEVGAKIGGGGMATVYIGRAPKDEGDGEELVALKVIKDELAHDEQFTHMFIDEAKILARLSHPNVIHTLEYGVSGDHRFIAMELLAGRTYADVWEALVERSEAMPPRLGAWICARVAEGLHSAHELVDDTGAPLSVIHRDVNPSNIFLTYAGDVKLIDFGLAKARLRVSKSADGIVKGKIPYLAPEQAHGQPIDRRIDIYALGATLWESATMKRLFKRETDIATLKAIRDAEVPDVRTMVEGFPDELWAIIDKALQRERDDRYATADDLRAALDAFVGDASDMPGALSDLLARLYPGQEARHVKWLRAATSMRLPAHTMPPPAPLPTASSSLLGEDEGEPSDGGPRSARAERDEASARDDGASGGDADGDEDEGSDDDAPAPRAPRARPSSPRPSDDRYLAHATDPHGAKRLWVSFLVVGVVVVVIALLLGAR